MNTEKQDLDHLSQLPGNLSVKEELYKTLDNERLLAVYIDLTDFKPYNEVYGFAAGDNAIIGLAEILKDARDRLSDLFAGHIGGDDFICLTDEDNLEPLIALIKEKFSILLPTLYSSGDLSRKFIVGWSRSGERKRFPLMGICAAAFSPARRRLRDPVDIARFAGYLKEAAKSMREEGGSVFLRPSDIDIIRVPLDKFIKDETFPLITRRTLIESMGESGYAHCGRILSELLDEDINSYLLKSIIYSLGRLRYTPASGKLLELLKCDNPHLRMRAAEALGNIGGSDYIEALGGALRDKNNYVSVAAAKALGDAGDPSALESLRALPENSPGGLQVAAEEARARLGDLTVSERLIERINLRTTSSMIEESARALELIPTIEAARAVGRAVQRSKTSSYRNPLILSFCRITEKLPAEDAEELSELILQLYSEAPEKMRVFFLKSIGLSGGEKAKRILIERLSSRSKWERKEAVEGLGRLRDPEVELSRYLRRMLKDYAPAVRGAAAGALGNIPSRGVLSDLRKLLKDPEPSVRRASARSVMRIMRSKYDL